MSSRATEMPVPGGLGPRGCRPMPAPPFNPTDYWATRKWVSANLGAVESEIGDLRDEIADVERKTRPLEGLSPFRLGRNEDLYYALSAIIPRLGGTVTGD